MECWFTIRGAFSLIALPQTDAMTKTPSSADDYRKRAAAIGKRLGRVGDKKYGLKLVRRKQQALLDLADNEDWLAGRSKERANPRTKPKAKVRRRLRPASSV